MGVPDRLRRSPNYLRFVITGVIVGIVVGGLLALTGDGEVRNYTPNAVMGYFSFVFGMLGGFAGGLLAIMVDRRR